MNIELCKNYLILMEIEYTSFLYLRFARYFVSSLFYSFSADFNSLMSFHDVWPLISAFVLFSTSHLSCSFVLSVYFIEIVVLYYFV